MGKINQGAELQILHPGSVSLPAWWPSTVGPHLRPQLLRGDTQINQELIAEIIETGLEIDAQLRKTAVVSELQEPVVHFENTTPAQAATFPSHRPRDTEMLL